MQVPDGDRPLEPIPPIVIGALWLLSRSVQLSLACLPWKLHPDPESPVSGKKKKRDFSKKSHLCLEFLTKPIQDENFQVLLLLLKQLSLEETWNMC